jgi:two-component system response regulator (stage 0 sporulation protein F)
MSGRVLVVEDDPSIRNGMRLLLAHKGHGVAVAASVAQALAELDSATPTHLLLDLNLPDGAGTLVLKHIRTEAIPIRVAVVSGGADSELMAEARTLGVEAVFIKPPNWDKVLDWVAQP